MSTPAATPPRPVDREALRRRYRQERDKRLRADGPKQYLEPTGRFASLVEDPYTPRTERAPVSRDVTVAFIGGGFSGLCAGAKLKQAGIDDLLIIEGGGDFGGVWYWNRYPGAMCDTAAMVYLPLLEETGTVPSRKYVFAPEIHAHAKRIAEVFDLYPNALFSTKVERLEWDEAASRWLIRTDRGDLIRARFVGMGTGPLHRPKLPGIPGIELFKGHSFHTSRWDYRYTGGTPAGAPMEKLKDKRVGIVGTGATSVQCIPPLARDSRELYVFQRTPSSIDVRNNHEIDASWFEGLEAGWQRKWLVNFAQLQSGGFAPEDLVQDGWTELARRIRDRVVAYAGNQPARPGSDIYVRAYEDSDDEKMEEIRARVDAIVADRETAEHLKPWYRQLCKRPCFHDEYLQAYNIEGTHLVDTDGKGVERIDETGVWVAGRHYPLDCLIFASGFQFGADLGRRCGFETYGRDGRMLGAYWADGMRTLHGMHVHGFPNLFITSIMQGAGLLSNITHNLSESAETMTAVIRHALDIGAREVEASEAAQEAWVGQFDGNVRSMLGDADCTPGYYNNEGAPAGQRERLNGARYPAGAVAFFEFIDRWRRSGDFEGLAFGKIEPAAARAPKRLDVPAK
ncbi:MAG: NAD(P)/FAD-dependent oxidoreductase [Alphaproteobacteria bacterium]|nr:NAD(P)/FAD-dependent oxidoreductase [Alphaproteobacteria bacterium]